MRAVALEFDRLRRGDRAGEVGAGHRGLGGDPITSLRLGGLTREDSSAHRAPVADVPHERPGVDT